MIAPNYEKQNNDNKVFSRKMVKLKRETEDQKIEKKYEEEKVKNVEKEAKFIQNFSKEMPHRWVQTQIYDNDNFVMKPHIDASNKQIFA